MVEDGKCMVNSGDLQLNESAKLENKQHDKQKKTSTYFLLFISFPYYMLINK